MMLVASVIEVSGTNLLSYFLLVHFKYLFGAFIIINFCFVDFEWCLTDNSETQERSRFFLIILNLATIEVYFVF